jgi:sugar/nucleoside kinase (ribokinase family)
VRLGVLGSMVWDCIEHPDGEPVDRWGGIAYSLAAVSAALPAGWSVRPIIKVGEDLASEAAAFLATLPGLELPGGIRTTPEPNNRVRLRYRNRQHRDEQLTGGVPGWTWSELKPLLEGLDALYVNLISGFELDLETAEQLRPELAGPVYADLHSLVLGVDDSGHRAPVTPEHPDRWVAAFDVVQVNQSELAILAADEGPWGWAESMVRVHTPVVLVTLGPDGAVALARSTGPRPWDEPPGRVQRLDAPVTRVARRGDPTGCGDVWGATCFVSLAAGETVAGAVHAANRAAARNTEYRGAEGLHTFLTEAT